MSIVQLGRGGTQEFILPGQNVSRKLMVIRVRCIRAFPVSR